MPEPLDAPKAPVSRGPHEIIFSGALKLQEITPRVPIYTARVEPHSAGEIEKALRDRLGFSATIPSNVESIVNYMQDSELFRQFRQGDVAMDRWDRSGTTADRLRQALSFLYY